MFVYDVTNYSSFEDLDDWYSYVNKCFREAGADMPKCALVANKSESIGNTVYVWVCTNVWSMYKDVVISRHILLVLDV